MAWAGIVPVVTGVFSSVGALVNQALHVLYEAIRRFIEWLVTEPWNAAFIAGFFIGLFWEDLYRFVK